MQQTRLIADGKVFEQRGEKVETAGLAVAGQLDRLAAARYRAASAGTLDLCGSAFNQAGMRFSRGGYS